MLETAGFSGTLRALTHAENAGVPVILPVLCKTIDIQNDPVEASDTLIDRLRNTYPWSGLENKKTQKLIFQPSALVEFDSDKIDSRLITLGDAENVCSYIAELTINALIEDQATNLAFSTNGSVTAAIRPLTNSWLHSGACIIIASIRPNAEPLIFSTYAENGNISFGNEIPDQVNHYVDILSRILPFALDAHFINDRGRFLLIDVTVSNTQQFANSELLLECLKNNDGFTKSSILLANCATRPVASMADTDNAIGFGLPQGERWACGPLATSLESAAKQIAEKKNPILVLDHLLPSQTVKLKNVVGLALKNDGAASHITILARSSGLAVLSNFRKKPENWPDEGVLVTLTEAKGMLFGGAPKLEVSVAEKLAPYLFDDARDSVSLASTTPPASGYPEGIKIGLCRSEMQILNSLESSEFLSYLAVATISMKPKDIPPVVASRFEIALEEMITNSNNILLNYRLIDIDLEEVLGANSFQNMETHGLDLSSIRGPRWAIETGFYEWQINMALGVANRQYSANALNLVLTLPSAFDVVEVAYVRQLFDRALLRNAKLYGSVHFGVMIETPRLCAQAHLLPKYADVFCFGLNDLTAATFGLSRKAKSPFAPFYFMSGLLKEDPFGKIDLAAVEPLVKNAMKIIRNAGGKGPIFLCGTAAESPNAHRLIAGLENTFVSVDHSNWSSSVISNCREKAKLKTGLAISPGKITELTDVMIARTSVAVQAGFPAVAAELALEWFNSCCPLKGGAKTQNWKVLKKWLAAAIFGELEGRFFMPGWNIECVVSYLKTLLGSQKTIRLSCFKNEISCHSRSEVVDPEWNSEEFLNFVASFDQNAVLHVFPQQNANQLCFRAVFTESKVIVEAGWGQAMYVFENERGQHDIVTARFETNEGFSVDQSDGFANEISGAVSSFLEIHQKYLFSVGGILSKLIGMRQFAIEGYFNPNSPNDLAIVDIDLPLDIAWNVHR